MMIAFSRCLNSANFLIVANKLGTVTRSLNNHNMSQVLTQKLNGLVKRWI